jgi:hypothetical protein
MRADPVLPLLHNQTDIDKKRLMPPNDIQLKVLCRHKDYGSFIKEVLIPMAKELKKGDLLFKGT